MKSTRRIFQGFGIWVAIMPFLHFPINVRNILYVVTGIAIFLTAYLYLRKRTIINREKIEPTFVESIPQEKTEQSSPDISLPANQ